MRCGPSSLSLLALSAALAFPAAAQTGDAPAAGTSPTSRTTAYEASFFAQYAPRTALDIVRRVPGFALDLGSTQTDLGSVDIRGFAGVAGNVVINGARPSSKAETLETTLSRIPASQVLRVELGPGDIYGADFAGKSQVLNIILSSQGGVDGNVTVTGRRLYTGKIVPDGSVSAMIRKGQSTVILAAGAANTLNHEEGTDTLVDVATGERIEFRRKFNTYHDFNPYVSASWALEKSSNDAIRLNARWSPGQFDLTQRNHVIPTGEPERDDDLLQDFDNPVIELGGDITRPLAGGAIKLVGLATRRKRDYLERYRFRSVGGEQVLGGFEQLQDAQRNETIMRLNWTKPNIAGFSFETGVEAALNSLDHRVELFEFLEGGEPVRIDLPLDEAEVREKRGELYVRAGRQLTPAIRIDGGLNYEFSELNVRGDTEADRSLKFLKPSVTLDWKGPSRLHGQLSVRRTVAQLDFYDFISSAELSADRVNGGNANLVPQRSWEFRLTLEKPVLGDGLAKIDLGHDITSNLQDRVLICDPVEASSCFDAPGNIGTGRRWFASGTLDAPLAKLGLNGARLKLTGQIQRTRVEDPVSGEKRNFSGFFPDWEWNIEYRHDIGAISYGFAVNDRDRFTFFRTDEFDINWNGGPFATAFVEYRPDPRTSITLDVDNAIATQGFRKRRIFIPNRASPDQIIEEFRERNRHLNFGLTLKRTFGGASGSSGLARPT
ncbi:MAG: outer membrane beta-barrel protein [Sphingomonas sp.]|nr:outer membrane beta-barrel protein [Sphingomonas sp.]